MLFNLFSNLIVIFTVFKTGIFKKRATRTMLYLSVSNMLVALVTQPYMLYHFYDNGYKVHHCAVNIQTALAMFFFRLISIYIIMIMVYDNHIRIKFVEEYHEKMKSNKIPLYVAYVSIVAFMQTISLGIAAAVNIAKAYTSIAIPVDIVLFIMVSSLHFKSAVLYKKYKQTDDEKLQYINKELNKLCSIFLVTTALFNAPAYLLELIEQTTSNTKQGLSFLVLFGFIFSNSSCTVYAFTFIITNNDACKFCKRHIRKLFSLVMRKKVKVGDANSDRNEVS